MRPVFWNMFGFILPKRGKGGGGIKLSAQELNNQMYMEIFNRVSNVALSRFKWSGLPESCRPEVLEMTLFFYGRALFFEDPLLGYLHTPVNLPGPFNVYYESVKRIAYSFEYYAEYDLNNSVLIKANHNMFPDYQTVWNYTPKIANCMRAIDVHTETLKRPYMIVCPEKMVESARRILEKIGDNEIAVIGEQFGDNGEIKILPLATSSNLQDMWANVKNYLNQVYSSLGVKNSYTEKKERMITAEAEGEGNAIRHALESELAERQLACERINRMFGLNVSVEANETEQFMDELIEAEAARVTGLVNLDREEEEDDVLRDREET